MRRAMILVCALSLAAALSAAPASAEITAAEPTLVEKAYPGGLPEGAVAIDGDTVVFGGGTARLDLEPMAFEDCPAGNLCFWKNQDFSGGMFSTTQCCQWENLPGTFDNEMSSWRNRRDDDSRWAYGYGGNGTVRCMDSHSSDPFVGSTDNDKASSYRNLSTDGAC